MKISLKKFEIFCRGLLRHVGIDIDATIGGQYVVDGGSEGFGYVTSDAFRTIRAALQVKRQNSEASAPKIDKFRGAVDKYNAEFGIFIATSDFTRGAIKGTRINTLINGDNICDLVVKYQYYVKLITTYKLDNFYKDKK